MKDILRKYYKQYKRDEDRYVYLVVCDDAPEGVILESIDQVLSLNGTLTYATIAKELRSDIETVIKEAYGNYKQ